MSTQSETLAEIERAHIEKVLAELGGNKSRAARVLGIDRRTLHRKIEKLQRGEKLHRKDRTGS